MNWRISIEPVALKALQKLPAPHGQRVRAAIEGLREDPYAGKTLQGKLAGLRALRVWPYRIIYALEKRTITIAIVAVGHRRDVYR